MKNLKKIDASKQKENFEKETFFDGTTTTNREINYIFAPDGLIAIYENKNGIGKMFYTATENIGFLFFASALRPAQVSSECKK